MRIEKFEDILSWQKAVKLAVFVYKVFEKNRDYGFKDQVQRAVLSISNNIAEGYERRSNKEFKQFLYIAKGSCGEVRSMAYVALDMKYLNKNDFDKMYSDSSEISRLLSGLIKTL
ncbi:MAG: four helix bundle protein [bacterium]|nr:four helix bundle protein [bacterium]